VPEDADVTGVVNGTGTWCEGDRALAWNSFSDLSTYCRWRWRGEDGINGFLAEIYRAKQDGVTIDPFGEAGCTVDLDEGEYAISLDYDNPLDGYSLWIEKTTGFACVASTGKISGTHPFAAGPCYSVGLDCAGTPTITVDP
jgi:hypothetical protein